ncbi:MAG: hypothetical protein PUC65_13020 [Clostridiales bacterium]|nr:hypothetical protein [Clostridiales bacterium]
MRLTWEDQSVDRQVSFERIDLSDIIRRVNRFMATGSYEEALQWINHCIKRNIHSRDQETIDTLLNIKIQIILVQAEQNVKIHPRQALEDCKEAYQCYVRILKKERDYNEKINYILRILYEHHVQYQKYRELYQLLRKAQENAMESEGMSSFIQFNYLSKKLKEGIENAQGIEMNWAHKWRKKLHILKEMKERYYHSQSDLDQIGSFYEHGKAEFYFSPDLHSKEHPHREVSLLFYNNDFFVARDKIVQDVLGTYRMMSRNIYGKSKVRLKES